MKKWIKLLLVSCSMAFIGFALTYAHNANVAPTYAEEVFEEKTYTFECEEGVSTITLKNETECVITMQETGGELLSQEGTYVLDGDVLTVTLANGNSMKVLINNETMTFDEYVEEEQEEEKGNEIAEKIQNFKDTYLVPLFTSVSLASVFSALVSIIFAIKNRNSYNLITNSNTLTQNQALLLIESSKIQAEKAVNLANEAVIASNNLIEEVRQSKDLSVEAKAEIIKQFADLNKQMLDLATKVETLYELKTCIIMLIQVQNEMAKCSPQAISSGAVKQIDMLNEQAKKLL